MIRDAARRCSTLVRLVVIAGLASLWGGCASRSDRLRAFSAMWDERSEERWWLGDKADLLYPRQWYFVGVGTCGPEVSDTERMDCAIQRAVGQAVAMVRQDVRVDIRRTSEFVRQGGPEGFEARIRSTYRSDGIGQAELTVDDVAPRRRTCSADGVCHALVSLDRRVLAARSSKKVAQWKAQIDELLDRAEQSDTLSAIEQLSMAGRLAANLEREAELLEAVAGPSAVPRSTWNRLSAVRSKRLQSVAVCLSSSVAHPPAELVFSRAHRDLATRGFARVAIASEPDCPEGSLSVAFRGQALERTAEYRLWVHEIRGMVVLRADTRTLGKGASVLGRGVSPEREQARSEAEQDLATNVQEALARLLDPTGAGEP